MWIRQLKSINSGTTCITDARNAARRSNTSSPVTVVIQSTPLVRFRSLTTYISFATVFLPGGYRVGVTTTNNLQRPEPQALAATVEALATRFGNRLITSQAVRDQHPHTTTWLAPQPPDAAGMAPETSGFQDAMPTCGQQRGFV